MQVQAILSYAVAGAEHMTSFKGGTWDGRSSFFHFKNGTFPAGFVHFVAAKLRAQGYTVNQVRKPLPTPLGPLKPIVDAFGDDPRYDYQYDVVNRLVRHGQIIAQVATGGGKSRIAKMAFARLGMPTLFLTTRGILMYQMKESFERDLKIKVSVLGDGQFGHTITEDGLERSAVRKMSVGMVQTLIARLEEQTVESELERMMDALVNRELKAAKTMRKDLEMIKMPEPKIRAALATFEIEQEAARPTEASMKRKAAIKVEQHMKERAQTINLLGMFGLVILEEAHEASGNSYYEILQHCKNAHYRLALTATPFMKDSEESNMRLMACSGPIAIKITEKMLIDRGILAQPHFKIISLPNKPTKLHKHTGWQPAYRIGIVDNEYRNKAIVDECLRMTRYGLSSMVLIQQTKHGEILTTDMAARGLRVMFIQGEDDQDGRKAALARLGNGTIDVLIGTTILDVGVDVPSVGHICLAGGGKAEVALRQRIGRGLRSKKSGPNKSFVTDFDDSHNLHLRGHAQQRLAIIKGTPGFDENVLEAGNDFDFEALGFGKLRLAA